MSDTASQAREDKPYSFVQRAVGWGLILLVSLVCFFGTMWLTRGLSGGAAAEAEAPPPPELDGAGTVFLLVGFLILMGGFAFVVGLATYVVTLTTTAFTFDFTRPVWRGYVTRLWFANIVAPLGFIGAASAGIALVLLGPLTLAGAPPEMAAGVTAVAAFIVLQLATAWVDVWTPLARRLIRHRLAARGVSPQFLATGKPMGTSDPTQKSLKRVMVEQDVGMLWVLPDELRYLGDADDWTLPRASVVAIDRVTDAGSMVSYAGGRLVAVRYRDEQGNEKSIRLHPQGVWTIGGKKKALDALAAELEAWRAAPTAAAAQTAPV